MTDSHDTPSFLKDALKFGINLGLDRMNKLDELLGNPERNLKVIHIAGTNGKGSTSAYISSILASADKKVGVYTSPFLERFSERMRIIDGREGLSKYILDDSYGEIDSETLSELSDIVSEASSKMTEAGFEHPTEFELVTAIAYLWFSRNDVDIAVLETGLGGRLDSTNVISEPLCSVITSIGLDHIDRLGNTIEEISSEKAGIIKPGVPVFISEPSEMILDSLSQEKVREVFVDTSARMNSDITFVSKGDSKATYLPNGRMSFVLDDCIYDTSLLGEHQISNAALSIAVCKHLGIESSYISEGISKTFWKGRCEIMSNNPIVVLDGGHNLQGAISLADVLNKMMDSKLKDRALRVVMGVMADKAIDDMLGVFKEYDIKFEEVCCVKVNNPRTLDSHELCNKVKEVYNDKVETIPYEDAVLGVLDMYRKSKNDGMPLLITGSLYLLGQIRTALKEEVNSDSL